jgi:hypothetical protein
MIAFAVMSVAPNPALDQMVLDAFKDAHFQISANIWLVAARGMTSREVSERLNVKPGGIGGVVVVKIDGYFGLASREIWEWLNVKTSEAAIGEEASAN